LIQLDIQNRDIEQVLTLCNSMQLATLCLSLDLYITRANAITELLFSHTEQELINHSLQEICFELGIEPPIATSTTPESLKKNSNQTTHWLSNQKIVNVDWSLSRCLDDNGYTGYILVGKIMMVCAAKQPLVKLENILRNLPCAIFSKDEAGYCISVNKYQAQIAGFSTEQDMIGKHATDMPWFIADPDVIHAADKLAIKENTTIVVEEHGTLSDGKQNRFLVTKSPYRDAQGKLLGVIGTSINITAQKAFIGSHNFTPPFSESSSTRFSKKETECIQWMIKGKSSAEIAAIMTISKRTVEAHMNSIKRKLNCYKQFQIGYLIGKYGYLLL
jgi:PAS domain S-box-containing protein